MRIPIGVLEPLLEPVNGLFAKNMFNFFSVLMDVIDRHMRSIGEINFPQAVITDDLAGPMPSLRG